MLLGCIGDDFTGSSDLANTLAKQGMHTVQYCGLPTAPAAPGVEAGVVALKSRSAAAPDAVARSLAALDWLREQGCRQYFFKYCSTFDSTREGNIGPVAEALAEALGAESVVVCPAFPGTGRSVYQGHLFVDDRLLNESGMQNHPLTPMVDADIRRWLGYQVDGAVGHVAATRVFQGVAAIRQALADEQAGGKRLIVVDAIRDEDLMRIGEAVDDLPLITGGSGVAMGLPANFKRRGLIGDGESQWQGNGGRCVVLSGSCSSATRRQVEKHRSVNPAFELVVGDVIPGKITPAEVADWVDRQQGVAMVYSSADPETVAAVQGKFGRQATAQALEQFFAALARQLVQRGCTRLLVAGGETSGAVVEGLGISRLEIGPEIDPGVPALRAGPDLVLALKSGNFGADDYFSRAARVLAGEK